MVKVRLRDLRISLASQKSAIPPQRFGSAAGHRRRNPNNEMDFAETTVHEIKRDGVAVVFGVFAARN
jgi:hypothetical protein